MKPTFSRRYRTRIIVAACVLSIAALALCHSFTKAEVATFYAGNCLGTWINAERAQGEPESFQSGIAVGSENSAQYKGGSGQIFCGKFIDDGYETKGTLRNVSVAFIWRVGEDEPPAELSPSSSSVPEPQDLPPQNESSTPAVSSGQTSAPALGRFVAVAHAEEPESESAPSSTIESQETPAPVPASAPHEDAPAGPAVPQIDSSNGEGGGTDQISVPGAEGGDSFQDPATSPEASSSSAASTTPAVFPAPPEPDEHFLNIRYNTDGEHWIELAKVSKGNWPHFTVTLPVTSWDELRKIQLSIEDIATALPETPPVYLDGLVIEAHYDVPRVELKEEDKAGEAVSSMMNLSPSVTVETPIPKAVPVLPEPEIVSALKTGDHMHVVVRYPGPFTGEPLNVFLYPNDAVLKRNSPSAGFSFEEAPDGPFIDAVQLFEKDFNQAAEAEFDVIAPNANPDYGLDSARVPAGTYALDIAYYDGYTWHLTQKYPFVWMK